MNSVSKSAVKPYLPAITMSKVQQHRINLIIFKRGRYYGYQFIIVIFKLEDHFCERVKADKKKTNHE